MTQRRSQEEIYPNEFYLKEQKFTVQKLVLNEPESIMPKSSAKSIYYKTKTPIIIPQNVKTIFSKSLFL